MCPEVAPHVQMAGRRQTVDEMLSAQNRRGGKGRFLTTSGLLCAHRSLAWACGCGAAGKVLRSAPPPGS